MTIKNTLLNIFLYLRNPKVPQSKKFVITIKSFFILFIFSMCIDYFLDLISTNYWLINKLQVTNTVSHKEKIYADGFWISLILMVISAPLIEELLQRSYLKSFIWNNVFVPINIGLILIFTFHIRGYYLLVFCPIILVISNMVYTRVLNYKKEKFHFLRSYINKYNLYFYLSAISFGAAHIGNYESAHFIPLLPIFLVLSQIFGGFLLGYIRVFMGLRWSILFHALHNLFILILLFINHKI